MNQFKNQVIGLCCAVVIGLTGCSSSTSEKLTLTGSSTIAPLAAELAAKFEALHPNIRIDVQAGGSSRGVADARAGLADIGMASRALKSSEQDLIAHTIAYDGIAIILNTQNPIDKLTDGQIKEIYTGKITNWTQLGGPNQIIIVVNKAEGHSTLELFLHYFHLKNSEVKADIIIGGNQQGIKTVVGSPWAVAYISIGSAEYEALHGAAIKLLGMGGVKATTEMVRKGVFPLSRPLNLVTKDIPEGWAKKFIEFAQSKEARPLVEKQFFVAINENDENDAK